MVSSTCSLGERLTSCTHMRTHTKTKQSTKVEKLVSVTGERTRQYKKTGRLGLLRFSRPDSSRKPPGPEKVLHCRQWDRSTCPVPLCHCIQRHLQSVLLRDTDVGSSHEEPRTRLRQDLPSRACTMGQPHHWCFLGEREKSPKRLLSFHMELFHMENHHQITENKAIHTEAFKLSCIPDGTEEAEVVLEVVHHEQDASQQLVGHEEVMEIVSVHQLFADIPSALHVSEYEAEDEEQDSPTAASGHKVEVWSQLLVKAQCSWCQSPLKKKVKVWQK
ncbi:hypothetical protein LUU34_00501000 [Aix galericulata]|nr:hypothetical protein LUU34_00501000 [Aix galericulata]